MSVFKCRLLMLAEKIENPDETPTFNMERYSSIRNACETPFCAAGWAVYIWGNFQSALEEGDFFDRARDLLGLVDAQAKDLFIGRKWPNKDIADITREDVAIELRRLAALA